MSIDFPKFKELDFVALGRLCVDLNANEIHRPMEETETFTKYVGGSPANVTIAMARLNAKTGFIGKVSDDQMGRFARQYFEKENINTSSVAIDQTGAMTGLTFTEIKAPDDCNILMYRDNAADLKLSPEDVHENYVKGSRSLLISGTALASSPSREAALTAIKYAEKHEVPIIFDLDYRPYSWNNEKETSVYYQAVAEKSSVIMGGRAEFDVLETLDKEADGSDAYTSTKWMNKRAEVIVIKHGGEGSITFTKEGDIFKQPVFQVEVVKTFGGGDAFAGAFIYGLLQKWPVSKCVKFGTAAASMVVASHSCSDAMPSLEEIEGFIALQEA